MSISDIIEGKRQWRAHMARVKALPHEYQVVCRGWRHPYEYS
jgi:DNA-binding ferritin-like protein (Dps family)